ncbi:unnamed protein product [Zymoseptoria tritici ST99CH_1A5]|uniref:N-acetylglucosamine-induced protein 1 n=1 Tax=Zymoseptoria tritici ST99CH_1A5 TaxID=1276529 RepID=A0A1Y6L2J5_ZYMTR|nr:unnamed protein product [Zymoseptoria tritici ST99CH_1A5]
MHSEHSQNNTTLQFWNTNLPPPLRTPTCPSFLLYAYSNPKDLRTLSTPDAHFTPQTWSEVATLIAENRLEDFQRVPSELYRYRKFVEDVEREWGSVVRFLVRERLGWEVDGKGRVVGEEGGGEVGLEERLRREDLYKILPNDWPYGLSPSITHLVVWTKFTLPTDPDSPTGDLTPAAKNAVQAFVDRKFSSVCGKDNVLWFRNGAALKSVRAVEHFHVLLRDAKPEWVEAWTGGRKALAEMKRRQEDEAAAR